MTTPGSQVEGEHDQVPLVAWDQIGATEPLAEGHSGEHRRALLRLPGGRSVLIVLKLITGRSTEESRPPLAEAQVLHTLVGVPGVPHLYGATRHTPHILAIGWCPGVSVQELWRRGVVRACLAALLGLCPILAAVHGRRVCHGSLRCGRNILSDGPNGSASVWLVGFDLALRGASAARVATDVRQVQSLVTEILEDMDKAFDPAIFQYRTEAMARLGQAPHLDVVQDVLGWLLRRHPA